MDCLNSLAPSDEELISFALDDEALPSEADNHLHQCEICQERLTNIQTDQRVPAITPLSQSMSVWSGIKPLLCRSVDQRKIVSE